MINTILQKLREQLILVPTLRSVFVGDYPVPAAQLPAALLKVVRIENNPVSEEVATIAATVSIEIIFTPKTDVSDRLTLTKELADAVFITASSLAIKLRNVHINAQKQDSASINATFSWAETIK